MSPSQTTATHDLRSIAVDYKRDSDRKHKWAFGDVAAHSKRRPMNRPSQRETFMSRQQRSQGNVADHRRVNAARKRALNSDLDDTVVPAVDDLGEVRVVPEPDAEITYSYDAPRGPNKGSQILGLALEKAVERFENKETDKLIRTEYEVLESDGESIADRTSGSSKEGTPLDDDDFELV